MISNYFDSKYKSVFIYVFLSKFKDKHSLVSITIQMSFPTNYISPTYEERKIKLLNIILTETQKWIYGIMKLKLP